MTRQLTSVANKRSEPFWAFSYILAVHLIRPIFLIFSWKCVTIYVLQNDLVLPPGGNELKKRWAGLSFILHVFLWNMDSFVENFSHEKMSQLFFYWLESILNQCDSWVFPWWVQLLPSHFLSSLHVGSDNKLFFCQNLFCWAGWAGHWYWSCAKLFSQESGMLFN